MLRSFLIALLATGALAEDRYCNNLSCAPKEELLEVIEHYRYTEQTNRLAQADSNCTACYSQPCLNGGKCMSLSRDNYWCDCPDNFGGAYCKQNIQCTSKSCGLNANCYVANHQINCVCKKGFSGDPVRGCRQKSVQSCTTGDPHYKTFDGLRYDYQGTCPYIFSQPCGTLANGYSFYSVKAKNEFTYGQIVATIAEIEVNMANITIHVDKNLKLYVNNVRNYFPWYYPNKNAYVVKAEKVGGRARISNDEGVYVQFVYGDLCVTVPDVPEFQGSDTLCGLAGNRDNKCLDDFRKKNGEVVSLTGIGCYFGTGVKASVFGDSWITKDFTQSGIDKACVDGQSVTNVTAHCDKTKVSKKCEPIFLSKTNEGPFKNCAAMGEDEIQSAYDDCIYDVCYGIDICSALELFVRKCQAELPGVDVAGWRQDPTSFCPYTCQAHATYMACSSSCASTCTNPIVSPSCGYPCAEGCTCDPGYVIDNTYSTGVKCIPLGQCGCTDINGNIHPANEPWLDSSCMNSNVCTNGTLVIQPYMCDQNAYCGVVQGQYSCVCNPGYTGDGTHCTDINECLDPTICGQNQNHGTCTNTPGSYFCTCNQYYFGSHCEQYLPARHCADFYVYHKQRTDGVYSITPPYHLSYLKTGETLDVYCKMSVDGGGYTLMSSAAADLMANRKLAEYERGFGNPGPMEDQWLGLEVINGMTQYSPTSLRLDLHRCKTNLQPDTTSQCTYDRFAVLGKDQGYAVNIPKGCVGDETIHEGWNDGWTRWNLSQTGPVFSAMDNDKTPASCSASFRNTGWWFDTSDSARCGSANLNGVRYTCDNQPAAQDKHSYLFWAGDTLQMAKLWLRPFGYPNYDQVPNGAETD